MRQRDYPKQLMIGDNLWQVKFVRLVPGHCENILGLCDPGESTIYIKQGQSARERFDSFVHELLHAADVEYDLKLKHKFIYRLSEIFAAIMYS